MGNGSSDPFDELSRAALAIPVTLAASAIERCRLYVDTLLFWNRRLSLTSATTVREIVLDHILDSLHLVPFIKAGCRVADIGSGAGFPGIPLAIACQQCSVVLVESRRKKANFLREAARRATLPNVEVVEERAEELLRGSPQPFDCIVSRAVGPVRDLLTLARPLLARDGLVIAMKGPKGRQEVTMSPGFARADVAEYRLPSGAPHLLLVYRRL
jgi:16S rRNA (guanine527-N7)-methyltransferase